MELSVVLPVWNEEANVEPLVNRIIAALSPLGIEFEVIFVDDGSTDRTVRKLVEMKKGGYPLRIAVLRRHKGQHGAILTGLYLARGRFYVILDADLQDPPEEIPRFLNALQNGADLVDGYRISRNTSPVRKLYSRLINMIAAVGGRSDAGDLGCMFRGFGEHPVRMVLGARRPVRYIPAALSGGTASDGSPYQRKIIEYSQEARTRLSSKYRIKSLVQLLADMIFEFDRIAKLRILGAGVLLGCSTVLLLILGIRIGAVGFYFFAIAALLSALAGVILTAVPFLPNIFSVNRMGDTVSHEQEIEVLYE